MYLLNKNNSKKNNKLIPATQVGNKANGQQNAFLVHKTTTLLQESVLKMFTIHFT